MPKEDDPLFGGKADPQMIRPKLGYSPHIDGLRAVAVAAVIVFHAFPRLLPGGFVGVDVFFVISGFLISSILYRDFEEPGSSGLRVIGRFYVRRIRRIFPALIAVLIACYLLGYRFLWPSGLSELCLRLTAAAGFFLNILLSRDVGYFNDGAATNPLLHLWSLSVEEQFYLIWPLAVWVVSRLRIPFLPTAVFFGACSYLWNLHRVTFSAEPSFFLLQTRVWELSMGAVAADLFPRIDGALGPAEGRWRRRVLNGSSVLGVLLLGLGIFRIRGDPFYPDAWALLPTVGTALVILSGGAAWANRHLLSSRLLVGLGLISYPLYLWHWPLLSFAHLASTDRVSGAYKLALICGAIGLAWLTYVLVENPIRHSRPGVLRPILLLAAMAFVANVGLYSYWKKGFPERFPKLIQELLDYRYPYGTLWREGRNFLDWGQLPTFFGDDPQDLSKDKPTLYLWGDSHAAGLYPGLRALYGDKLNIRQRTAAATPPIVAPTTEKWKAQSEVNSYVLAEIQREHPKYVVLAANWIEYDRSGLPGTIKAINASGAERVILVGAGPQWRDGLPQQLCNYWHEHPRDPIPTRLNSGYREEPIQIDRELRLVAEQSGATYVSPCEILGSSEGFLIRLGDTGDSLIYFDYGHLTDKGSIYLVSHFPKL